MLLVKTSCNFRKNKACWKLAYDYTETDSDCPSEAGMTWKYKVKTGDQVNFLDADDGLEVKCGEDIKDDHLVMDCRWGNWAAWGQCSKTCGGGAQLRSRSIAHEAEYGGNACSGQSAEMQGCNEDDCPKGDALKLEGNGPI